MNARTIAAADTHAHTPATNSMVLNVVYLAVCKAGQLTRAMFNRRLARKFVEFSDRELADIGLTREDVGCGLSQPLSADPTLEFARRARINTRSPKA